MAEPKSPEAVAAWIAAADARLDSFAAVREASEAHRLEHGPGCTVYPTSSGPLLGVLVAAVRARRVVELGCGLGYSALCLASGAAGCSVDTIERDPDHAKLAAEEVEVHGYSRQITIHVGEAAEVLPSLAGHYDVAFCDADPKGYADFLDDFFRLLRPGALLISANLFLGQFAPEIPHLDELAAYREQLVADVRVRTAFLPGGMALGVVAG